MRFSTIVLMLPPDITHTTVCPRQLIAELRRGCKRCGAGALGEIVRRAQRQPNALFELRLRSA